MRFPLYEVVLAAGRDLGYSRRMGPSKTALRYVPVARLDELPPGEMLRIDLDGEAVVLYRTPDGVFCTDDVCSHRRRIRLSLGFLEGTVIECPFDGGTFDVRTGKPIAGPCREAVRTHPVRVEGDTILLGLNR